MATTITTCMKRDIRKLKVRRIPPTLNRPCFAPDLKLRIRIAGLIRFHRRRAYSKTASVQQNHVKLIE